MAETIEDTCDNCEERITVDLSNDDNVPVPGTVFAEECPTCGNRVNVTYTMF